MGILAVSGGGIWYEVSRGYVVLIAFAFLVIIVVMVVII